MIGYRSELEGWRGRLDFDAKRAIDEQKRLAGFTSLDQRMNDRGLNA